MDTKTAIQALAALAQESRLIIFRRLVEAGPTGMSVGEIGGALKVSPATLSFHLKELAHAGLVSSRQEGRFVFYAANFARMDALIGFLTDNCCAREGACAPCAPAACAPAKPGRRVRTGAKR